MAYISTQNSILRVAGKQIEIASPVPGENWIRVLSQLLAVDQSEIHILMIDGEGNKYRIDWVGQDEHATYEPAPPVSP